MTGDFNCIHFSGTKHSVENITGELNISLEIFYRKR